MIDAFLKQTFPAAALDFRKALSFKTCGKATTGASSDKGFASLLSN
jgi:hypothetical protein